MENYTDHGGTNLKAGDYKLNKFVIHSLVSGTSINLDNLFKSIEIYEDIFSPYISAKVVVEDGNNLPEKLPIIGQEKIEIEFKSDINAMQPVKLLFRVYKMDSQSLDDNGKSQTYSLHLISEGGYFNFSQYCGYSLRGSVSKMVNSIFVKHFPDSVWKNRLDIERSNDDYSLIIPGTYTPLRAISWLCEKAHTTNSQNYTPFLFYETIDGYNFKSLSRILEEGTKSDIYYTYTKANMPVLDGAKETTGASTILPNVYLKVQQLDELRRFDKVSDLMTGIISSKLLVHDLIFKEARTVNFLESNVFEDMKKLGDNSHFRISDPYSYKLLSKGAAFFYQPSTSLTVKSNSNSIIDNHQVESLYLKRKYHMNTFLTQKLVISVFGDSRRRVGDVVNLDVFKPQGDVTAKDDKNDKNLSGKYLITSSKHIMKSGGSYTCKFELSRNGMGV